MQPTSPDFSANDFSVVDFLKFFIVLISGSIAAGVGVGGGAIYTVLFILLFGLVYEAIPLSKVTVLAQALSFFIQNVILPVPKETKHKYRFAYDVIMIMEPATLLGTVYGVIASRTSPYWLITFLMTILLSFSALKTFKKAHEIWELEIEGNTHERVSFVNKDYKVSEYGTILDPNRNNLSEFKLRRSVELQSTWFDPLVFRSCLTVLICFLLIVFNAFVSSNIGSDIIGLQITCGSFTYYGSIFAISVVTVAITLINMRYLEDLEANQETGTPLTSLAVHWTKRNSWYAVIVCFAAGFFSSLCGVGGSTIKNPVLLYLNINPTLAKSTSQFMLLTTVSSSALQFYTNGAIPQHFALCFFLISLVSTVIGKTVIDYYIRKTKKQSIVVYLLRYYILFSLVTMGTIGILIVVGQLQDWKNLDSRQIWFRSPCTSLPTDFGALKFLAGG